MKWLASGEKAVCLISGGIDSPVAAWLIIRKGCVPIFIYYDNHPYTDEAAKKRASAIVKKLCDYTPGRKVRFYVIPHGENLNAVMEKCPRSLTCILCKRMMYRMAEYVALAEWGEAVVTGEILGEHASQTSRNIRILGMALKELPVLRPLIGMDKLEVESLARKIGTFAISTSPGLGCSAFPRHPKTHASLKAVIEAEKSLDVGLLMKRSLERSEVKEV